MYKNVLLKASQQKSLHIVLIIVSLLVIGLPVSWVVEASETPSGRITVSIWGNQTDLQSQRTALETYQREYPDVEITIIEGDAGVSYPTTKILIAGGTMADVFVPGIWNYNGMIRDGILVDLEPYIERDQLALADFNASTIESMRGLSDGRLYGLPMGYNIQSLYYNKDMFDHAGLPYPPADGEYTWNDLREWARKLTLDENGISADSPDFDPNRTKQWGFYSMAVSPIPPGYEPILMAFGGSTMTLPDRMKCNLEHPASIEAWQFIQDMIWTDHSMVSPYVNQEQQGSHRFLTGQIAMMQGSHEQVVEISQKNPELRYDMAPLPKGPAGQATVMQLHVWAIYNGSKNKDTAWHLVKWLATEGSIAGAEDKPASLMGLIPVYKDYAMGPAFAQADNAPQHIVEAQLVPATWHSTTYPSGFNHKTDQIEGQDGIGQAIEEILVNKKTAAEPLKGISEKINAFMEE